VCRTFSLSLHLLYCWSFAAFALFFRKWYEKIPPHTRFFLFFFPREKAVEPLFFFFSSQVRGCLRLFPLLEVAGIVILFSLFAFAMAHTFPLFFFSWWEGFFFKWRERAVVPPPRSAQRLFLFFSCDRWAVLFCLPIESLERTTTTFFFNATPPLVPRNVTGGTLFFPFQASIWIRSFLSGDTQIRYDKQLLSLRRIPLFNGFGPIA